MNSFNLLLALPLVTLMLPGCIDLDDRSASEKHYLKKGATPKEAKRKAFEDEFFTEVNRRNFEEASQAQDPSSRAQRKEADDAWNGR